MVAVAWILSAIFSSPMLVLYEEGLVQGQVQCWIDFKAPWQWQLYLTLVAVSLLVLPALLIFACYIVIVRTIWVQSAALTSSIPSRNNNNTAGNISFTQFSFACLSQSNFILLGGGDIIKLYTTTERKTSCFCFAFTYSVGNKISALEGSSRVLYCPAVVKKPTKCFRRTGPGAVSHFVNLQSAHQAAAIPATCLII